jgi:glycerol-3-phosphate acyltransferase PlsY
MFSYEFLLLLVFAYLLGSIPFSYIAGRLAKGKDIRRYGSGTVGGSMVYEHVSHWLLVPVGILDVLKAAIPTHMGLLLDFGEAGAAVAGIAAMLGHNWPIFLGFTGGRGISTILGILVVLFPLGDLWLLGFLAVGYVLKDSAPWALASMATMPVLIWFMGGSSILYWLSGAVLLITLLKRLEANRRPLPVGKYERSRVIWLRLIFDRDIDDHQAWIYRQI